MNTRNDFNINFVALKTGSHDFNYKIDRSFFEEFEGSPIEDATAKIDVRLEKSENMLVFHFDIHGEIEKTCDLCLGPLMVNISGNFRQIVKFSDDTVESNDDEIVFIPTSAFEINISPYVYEFMALLDPIKATHEEGMCDNETRDILDEYLLSEQDSEIEEADTENLDEKDTEIDPRWSELLKLKKK